MILSAACAPDPRATPLGSSGAPAPTQSQAVAIPTAGGTASALGEPTTSAQSASAAKRYTGPFKARKRKVLPQSTAEDDAWKRDDGSFASGPGEVEMVVGPNDTVTGVARGPWGTLSIVGEASSEEVYATLSAADDGNAKSAHGAFAGILRGHIGDGALDVKMRVSSGDATIAREADARLVVVP